MYLRFVSEGDSNLDPTGRPVGPVRYGRVTFSQSYANASRLAA